VKGTELVAGLYSNRHTTMQMRTDLSKVIKGPGTPAELSRRAAKSRVSADTLVGLNYAYFERGASLNSAECRDP